MLRVHFFLHFYCYGMRSVMLQINEYDDDDDVFFLFASALYKPRFCVHVYMNRYLSAAGTVYSGSALPCRRGSL